MAESTFGRHVANDGKLVPRLRVGGRITTQTVDRIDAFIAATLADRGLEATPRATARSIAPAPRRGRSRSRPRHTPIRTRASASTTTARSTCSS